MKNIKLSKMEWEILRIIWEKGSSSVRDVSQNISEQNKRAYTTIQTYMERMIEKKLLKKEKIGLVNFYISIVEKKNLINHEISTFIQNVFNGSSSRFAAYLFNSDQLDEKDIKRIKEMIEEKEKKND
ncbi:MAG: hypothetical protein DRJ01_09805 [Bacteroidetes bacterium]|nr:MAG: hypothetical protein DRJ01_09805 [Bacteroidota bacterium]